jgi:glycosyltransferase involved in cell wall biosynthesis
MGGTREVIKNEQMGRIVPAKDAVGLSDAINELVRDKPLRANLGNAVREHVRHTFAWAEIATNAEVELKNLLLGS